MNSLIKKKIIIGTAHFGQNYGIMNKKKICYREIKSMLKFLDKNNIRTFDTASAYIRSEKILGKINIKNAKYITKIVPPSENTDKQKIEEEIKSTIRKSLIRLKTRKIYAVLLHRANCLIKDNGKIIYDALNDLKKKKLFQKLEYLFMILRSWKKF